MAYDLLVTDRASREVIKAIDYYDGINAKLGSRFLTELSETYQKLSTAPQLYSFILSNRKSNIRDVKLSSFPYVVIYEIKEKKVMILSVMNTHRKPLPL